MLAPIDVPFAEHPFDVCAPGHSRSPHTIISSSSSRSKRGNGQGAVKAGPARRGPPRADSIGARLEVRPLHGGGMLVKAFETTALLACSKRPPCAAPCTAQQRHPAAVEGERLANLLVLKARRSSPLVNGCVKHFSPHLHAYTIGKAVQPQDREWYH